MFKTHVTRWLALCGCLLTSAAFANPNITDADGLANGSVPITGQEWRFKVKLGKKDIGFHDFRVNEQGGRTDVEIRAEFDVKFLFINAYSYSHQNQETWEGDCLSTLASNTDDNGKLLSVSAQAINDLVVVDTGSERFEEPAECVRSFAYWNPAILDSERLLNSQTGEITDVKISSLGPDTVDFGGTPLAAEKYAIEMQDGTITLWYAENGGQWLALEAPTPGGRVIRYEPVELPQPPASSADLAQR